MSTASISWPHADKPGPQTAYLDPADQPFLIGRRPQADLRLEDPTVSRNHAALIAVRGLWFIEDIGSSGGTFLLRGSSRPVKLLGRERLLDGDRVRVGRTILRFMDPRKPDDARETDLVDDPTIVLTDRELDVLKLLCADELEGRGGSPSDSTIAATLFVSGATVRTHMRNLFRKFGLEDVPDRQKRARLVRRAIDEGWV